MKSLLINIQPKRCEKIAKCEETIEVQKTRPKEETPFKCYIYCTKGENLWLTQKGVKSKTELAGYLLNGKVIGEFICDKVDDFYCASVPYRRENNLGYGQFIDNGVYKVNGWHEGIVFERNDRYIDTMLNNNDLKEMCLTAQGLFDYIGVGKHLYGWHISDLQIYDRPRELSEFFRTCPTKEKGDCLSCDCLADNDYGGVCTNNLTRPPQSWMYVKEL